MRAIGYCRMSNLRMGVMHQRCSIARSSSVMSLPERDSIECEVQRPLFVYQWESKLIAPVAAGVVTH